MCQRYWFRYNGLDGDEGVIDNYSPLTTNPALCIRGPHLCAIYVCQEPDSAPPIPVSNWFTTNMQTYITDAKASSLSQPLSFPKYVYVRVS